MGLSEIDGVGCVGGIDGVLDLVVLADVHLSAKYLSDFDSVFGCLLGDQIIPNHLSYQGQKVIWAGGKNKNVKMHHLLSTHNQGFPLIFVF